MNNCIRSLTFSLVFYKSVLQGSKNRVRVPNEYLIYLESGKPRILHTDMSAYKASILGTF